MGATECVNDRTIANVVGPAASVGLVDSGLHPAAFFTLGVELVLELCDALVDLTLVFEKLLSDDLALFSFLLNERVKVADINSVTVALGIV